MAICLHNQGDKDTSIEVTRKVGKENPMGHPVQSQGRSVAAEISPGIQGSSDKVLG